MKQDSIVEVRNGEVESNDVYHYIKCFLQNTELTEVPEKWRDDIRRLSDDMGSGYLKEKNANFRVWKNQETISNGCQKMN